jgi:hypothetical protein
VQQSGSPTELSAFYILPGKKKDADQKKLKALKKLR